MKKRYSAWLLPPMLACSGFVQAGGKTPVELKGATDHPLISRFAGAVLQDFAQESFVALPIPQGVGNKPLDWKQLPAVEGPLKSYFYVAPKGISALEVFRNYQAALKRAGFAVLHTCETFKACEDQGVSRGDIITSVIERRPWQASSNPQYEIASMNTRFISAKANLQGKTLYILVFVSDNVRYFSDYQSPSIAQFVLQQASVDDTQVQVKLDALLTGETLKQTLSTDGKAALYGIHFDTGKALVKPESKPQLAEMAKLLQASPTLKVHIVGHTDNQGSLASNVTLSQQRAEAVAAVLAKDYRIDAKRLNAHGVASYAPVASNTAEAGRAKNRRVELVEQ